MLTLQAGQDVKRYPSSVRLDNQKIFNNLGPKIKYFMQFYFCRSTNNKQK